MKLHIFNFCVYVKTLTTIFQSDPVQSEYTLDGLRQVMAIKSKVVLPYLVPQVFIVRILFHKCFIYLEHISIHKYDIKSEKMDSQCNNMAVCLLKI